ncbi:MAG: nucleoside triphosphate pyrophosphohydrolase [Treponema sp.]|nr:nucleoside triphosphate pyrophosphohydrolase [Treponema sp.]
MRNSFQNLLDTIKTLRAPGGCPWDIDQTPLSMRHDLLEECFETIDAITKNDAQHAREELGDLMFNALVMCYMFEQRGDFTIDDVFDDVNAKIIRRHPHVFEQSEGKSQMEKKPLDSAEVLVNWDKIKENVEGRKSESVLDSVPDNFSSLEKSLKMMKKAAKKNFDWTSIEQVKAKFREELCEVQEAEQEVSEARKNLAEKPFTVSSSNENLNAAQLHLEEEIGDAIMAFVNYSRWVSVDPEIALDRSIRKFKKRFQFVEKSMEENGIPMDKNHLDEMIKFWNEAK